MSAVLGNPRVMCLIARSAIGSLRDLQPLAEGNELQAVNRALKELYSLIGPSSPWVVAAKAGVVQPRAWVTVAPVAGTRSGHVRQCPECFADLVKVDGCTKCPSCGWLGSCG